MYVSLRINIYIGVEPISVQTLAPLRLEETHEPVALVMYRSWLVVIAK